MMMMTFDDYDYDRKDIMIIRMMMMSCKAYFGIFDFIFLAGHGSICRRPAVLPGNRPPVPLVELAGLGRAWPTDAAPVSMAKSAIKCMKTKALKKWGLAFSSEFPQYRAAGSGEADEAFHGRQRGNAMAILKNRLTRKMAIADSVTTAVMRLDAWTGSSLESLCLLADEIDRRIAHEIPDTTTEMSVGTQEVLNA